MSASVPLASNNISATVEKLRRLSRWDVQSGWKYCNSDSAVVNPVNICNWSLAELNEKSHIAWPSGKQVLYLGQKIVVSDNLSGYPVTGLRLLLSLTWWAEDAQLFVNGELVGVGDLFDCSVRLLLSHSAIPGDEFLVILRLVSPSHDCGALVRSVCVYEAADSACFDPGFVADELEILHNSLSGNLESLNSQYLPTENIVDRNFVVKGERLKSEIELAVGLIDWSMVCDRQKFDRSLSSLRQNLLRCLRGFPADLNDGTAEIEKEKNLFEISKSDHSISNFQFPIPNSQFPKASNLSEKGYTSIYIGESSEKSSIYKGKIYLLGHAHLDLAWLWPVAETWEAAQRTFESALKLQSEFPDLIFCHSTPALYAWIEVHRPDLFAAIKKQVAAGHWEVVGGMWVEPDLNLISAESMVRQVFYGQRYTQEKFGELMRVVWLPDTFGFGWQLPQILRDGGVDYFVTQKLRWNDTTEFPHGVFWWEGLDGTKIFSMMSAAIGENIESVKMANHLFDWQVKTGLRSAFWLPGVGDHGGGPTRDMLEVAKRWEMSPFFPTLEFTKAVDYLSLIESQFSPEVSRAKSEGDSSIRESHPILGQDKFVQNLDESESVNFDKISYSKSQGDASTLPPLPIWKDELYLEFHRGCYTTHADQKRNNRRCEDLLYQAELLSSLATICAGAVYPKSELEIAWKQVLFNQFHDILPGSSIAQVYIDANLAFAETDRTCRQILLQSLNAIASQISLPSPPQSDAQPILIFNTLNWSRSEVVALSIPESNPETWQIYDLDGQRLVTQIEICDRPKPQLTLLFSANNIPAVGYRVFWLCRENPETIENSFPQTPKSKNTYLVQVTNHLTPKIAVCQETHFEAPRNVLENEFIRATIDWETGNLSSIWDKINNREVLNIAGGNQLQSFQDSRQYWDAWNIDPNYQKHQLPTPILKDIYWIAQGEIRQSLRVIQQIGQSEFCQDYIIEIGSPLLKIKTVINWQEKHILVKAAFGLNVEADFATCEIPGGAIERTTKPQTAAEKAKWEVPILRWVDISNDHFGVSLLNDCKYGCDLQPNQIRLTLLRSSTWPDEQADIGIHEFTYAVYPHSGNWQDADTVRQGYELNLPLLVKVLPQSGENRNKSLPAVGKFLDLSADNLVLMAFKQSEDDSNLWILRCCESEGKEAVLELKSDLGLEIVEPVDLLERPANLSKKLPEEGGFKIEPWKIATFTIVPKTDT
ncbi:alpha-mannosidase [Tychonema sp. BBK16]|uniref:alpha-mannosidase n=1 Tax=Tychonema sp. BBK16 TaxID=2699888 RepID=UPI001F437850|nr:alpha-mannosidase [Tychonema sp. BBK16]MCF6371544.1 alpha-mannosidase [Tychonema sp. BBK16]